MYGDVHYKWVHGGSCATSANTPHNFYGIYNGLSDLNGAEVVHLQLEAISGNAFRWGLEGRLETSAAYGILISPAGSVIDIPPIKVSDASAAQFINSVINSNASATFTIWRRGIL